MRSASMDRSFTELTELVKSGHDEAMGELARRHGPDMLQFANQLLGGALRARLDAEDLVQAALITLWLGIRTDKFVVPSADGLTALAKTLLRRQVARHWRKAKSEINLAQDAALIDTIVDQQLMPIAPEETTMLAIMSFVTVPPNEPAVSLPSRKATGWFSVSL